MPGSTGLFVSVSVDSLNLIKSVKSNQVIKILIPKFGIPERSKF